MAGIASECLRVVSVAATGGEAGEILDAALSTRTNLECLGALGDAGLRRGHACLGVTRAYFLDYRDSGMATPQNQDPRPFRQADRDEACGRLVRIVGEVQPGMIVALNKYGTDGHLDHKRASAERARKLRRAIRAGGLGNALPIVPLVARRRRPWHELERSRASRALSEATTRVDIRSAMDRESAAIRVHRTQIGPGSDRLTLTPAEQREVPSTEDFTLRVTRIAISIPRTISSPDSVGVA